jgi:cholesterol transport system auxiliary component
MRIHPARGAALWGSAILIALALAGCISVLPNAKPAQLYRFGADPDVTTTAQTAATGPTFTVRPAPIGFERASAGDRILTIDGDRAAYVGGARWISPAATLFEAALNQAFDAHGGPARLLAAGEPVTADYVLKIDVRRFEARYDHGPASTPRVVIGVFAALSDRKDPRLGASRLFEVATPAESNSAHALAAAFDQATLKVLGEMVAWVDAKGQTKPA